MKREVSASDATWSDSLPRDAPGGTAVLRFGGHEFDQRRQELRRNGSIILLAPKPSALLRVFLDHAGRLLSKDELMASVWGPVVVTDDSLVQCVRELRAALDDRAQKLIRTVPRRGYMLDTPVEHIQASDLRANVPLAAPPATGEAHAAGSPALPGRPSHGHAMRRWRWWLALGVLLLCAAGAARWKTSAQPAFRIDQEILARRTVAVLAFADDDARASGSRLGIELANAIEAKVARRQGMRAASPGAVAQGADPSSRGKVPFVVGGRILRLDGRLSVDSYVTSVETGAIYPLVQSDYASESEALQSNFGIRVVGALRTRFEELQAQRVNEPGHRLDAADLTLMGWQDQNNVRSREDLERSRLRFEAALAQDPRSVMASQGLGSAYLLEFAYGSSPAPERDLDMAERTVRQALAIGPEVPQNLVMWADILVYRGQSAAAMEVFRKALDINPNYTNAYLNLAAAQMLQGRYEEARKAIDDARRLSPRETVRLQQTVYSVSSMTAFAQGHDDEAYAWLRREAAEFPGSGKPYAMLAAIDALHGRQAAAAANMARHRELQPMETVAYVLMLTPSDDPTFLAARSRLIQGMRMAGLPER